MAKRFKSDSGSGSHARMPQSSFQKTYPKNPMFDTEGYDDTMEGIDSTAAGNVAGMKKNHKKSK